MMLRLLLCTFIFAGCLVRPAPRTAPPPSNPPPRQVPPPVGPAPVEPEPPAEPAEPPPPVYTPPVVAPPPGPPARRDRVKRVMFWPGKVNQYFDIYSLTWRTDPDGVSGAARNRKERIAYCQKWFPNTNDVKKFHQETIATWRERGNRNAHTATRWSWRCIERPKPPVVQFPARRDRVPRVMFWPGKVNQHFDLTALTWRTDPDGVSGAARNRKERLAYCQKWYPRTVNVTQFHKETIFTWRERGNRNAHRGTRMSWQCILGQPPKPEFPPKKVRVPRVMFWPGKVNQHWDLASLTWRTDPDGVSGAARNDRERLAYCNKWYPGSGKVKRFAKETIFTWRERGNRRAHKATRWSWECVPKKLPPPDTKSNDPTPRVMFWPGKVHKYFDNRAMVWRNDPGRAASFPRCRGPKCADRYRINFCKKFYPRTNAISKYKREKVTNWIVKRKPRVKVATRWSWKCEIKAPPTPVTPPPSNDPTPRVSFWKNRVNKYFDQQSRTWRNDPKGRTTLRQCRGPGCTKQSIIRYCQEFYPATVNAKKYKKERITGWLNPRNGKVKAKKRQTWQCLAGAAVKPPPAAQQDRVRRVMFWPGKVNQHFDMKQLVWETDPDGVSGAARNQQERLQYCKKWYPRTVQVRKFKKETISSWRERGNRNAHRATRWSWECIVGPSRGNDRIARVMFWPGKVNQHWDVASQSWKTDPDGVSGAPKKKKGRLRYCRKWYPGTKRVKKYQKETIATWRERGNRNAHTATKWSWRCIQ